jgi:hypothetical protein
VGILGQGFSYEIKNIGMSDYKEIERGMSKIEFTGFWWVKGTGLAGRMEGPVIGQ